MEHQVIMFIQQLSNKLSTTYTSKIEQQQVACWLLEKLTAKTEAHLIAQKTINLSYVQEKILSNWLEEHIEKKKPLQYILGTTPFLDLTIKVAPPVLIPRAETEEWVSYLTQQLKQLDNQKLTILDIGTGSGCIALALAKALPKSIVYATDISRQALELAEENSRLNTLTNIRFIFSDVYEQIPKNIFFDLIVSNPPYIAPEEWKTLNPSVTQWEDKQALVAPDKGLAIIFKIIAGSKKFFKENHETKQLRLPQLVLEIGYTQAETVIQIMEQAGFVNNTIQKDLSGKNRVITGRII